MSVRGLILTLCGCRAPRRLTPAPSTAFDRGYRAYCLGAYVRSAAEFRHALADDPDDADAAYYLGRSLADRGAHRSALEALRRAVERRPRDARAHYYLAVSLAACGESFAARRAMTEALRLDPYLAREGIEVPAASSIRTQPPTGTPYPGPIPRVG